MRKQIYTYISISLLLYLLQICFVSKIGLSNLFYPLIFFAPLLIIPANINKVLLIVLGFIMGVIADIFLGTIGLNTFVCVLLAFIRPLFINLFTPKVSQSHSNIPSSKRFGMASFIFYIILLCFVYHSIFFILESFGMNNLGRLLLQIIISSTSSAILILFIFFLFFAPKKATSN
jgi:hypothetical protein